MLTINRAKDCRSVRQASFDWHARPVTRGVSLPADKSSGPALGSGIGSDLPLPVRWAVRAARLSGTTWLMACPGQLPEGLRVSSLASAERATRSRASLGRPGLARAGMAVGLGSRWLADWRVGQACGAIAAQQADNHLPWCPCGMGETRRSSMRRCARARSLCRQQRQCPLVRVSTAEPQKRLPEHGFTRHDLGEQRHARAELHVVR